MAYDPDSPAQDNAGLDDIDQIRENCNQLRSLQQGSSAPTSTVAGMFWLYTPGAGDWVLKQRNSANDDWIDIYNLTVDDVPKAHIADVATGSIAIHGIKVYTYPGGLYSNDGTEIIAYADAEASSTSGTYEKVKEMKLNSLYTTSLKIYFQLQTLDAGETVYGRVYRNGSPVGIEQSTTGDTAWHDFTETIYDWTTADQLQLYIKRSGGSSAVKAKEFRILGTRTISIVMD